MGVCAALAAIALKNRRVLTLGQAAGILGTAAGGAAAAVAGDALLWGDHTFIPGARVGTWWHWGMGSGCAARG